MTAVYLLQIFSRIRSAFDGRLFFNMLNIKRQKLLLAGKRTAQ